MILESVQLLTGTLKMQSSLGHMELDLSLCAMFLLQFGSQRLEEVRVECQRRELALMVI